MERSFDKVLWRYQAKILLSGLPNLCGPTQRVKLRKFIKPLVDVLHAGKLGL